MTLKEKQESDVKILSSDERADGECQCESGEDQVPEQAHLSAPHERDKQGPQTSDMPAAATRADASPEPKPARRFPISVDIDRFGILSILAIMAVLAVAVVAPQFDKQAAGDEAAWKAFLATNQKAADSRLHDLAALDATKNPAVAGLLTQEGIVYLSGNGVVQNHAKALECFRKAAAAGDTDGRFYAALLNQTFDAKESKANYAEIKFAAAAGSLPAAEYLYWNELARGEKTPARGEAQRSLLNRYKALARNGSVAGYWGMLRISPVEDRAWLDHLESLAKRGDPLAQYIVGCRYVFGVVPQHFSTAYFGSPMQWQYHRDGERENKEGKFMLGLDYLTLAAGKGFAPAELAIACANTPRDGLYATGMEYPMIGGPGAWGWSVQTHRREVVSHMWVNRLALQLVPPAFKKLSHDLPSVSDQNKKQLAENERALRSATVNGGSMEWAELWEFYDRRPGNNKLKFDAALHTLNTTRHVLEKNVESLQVSGEQPYQISEVLEYLANTYRDGEETLGVVKNPHVATRLKILAIEARGRSDYSASDLVGYGITSAELIKELEKSDKPSAKTWLAHMYLVGDDCKIDVPRGIQILKDAATKRAKRYDPSEPAQQLGNIYRFGQFNIKVDYAEAAKYYRIAAIHGNSTAMLRLGELYDRGLGVQKDLELAVYWYQQALDNRVDSAAGRLRSLGIEAENPKHDFSNYDRY